MAVTRFVLVFSLAVALPMRSVLGQEVPWQSVVDQATQVGISQESINNALSSGPAQQALDQAEDAVEEDKGTAASWGDWVKGKAKAMGLGGGNSEAAPPDSPAGEAPEGTPESAPTPAPSQAPQAM